METEEEGDPVYGSLRLQQNFHGELNVCGLDRVFVVLGPRSGVGGRAGAERRQQVGKTDS